MKFHKLSASLISALLLLIVAIRLWIEVDQIFLHSVPLRFAAFIAIILVTLFGIFLFIKPSIPVHLANTLVSITLPIAISLSLIQHVIIQKDFKQYMVHSFIIWFIILAIPYTISFLYNISSPKLFGFSKI